MMFEDAIQIIKPEPDSHYRLLDCPECNGDNVAYIQKANVAGATWHGMCFDCSHTGKGDAIRHEAQKNWNGEVRYGI